jgi:protease-4
MGSESVSRAFREAVDDDDVRAIIFRVDSPGGSYIASDAIWRETVRARAAGKPVIVSMGDYAASGGYFVSMSADHIVAQPSTLTGSIGVYGGKILVGGLTEKLGITWDDVRTGGNSTMWSTVEDYSPAEWARLQAGLDRIYEDFTSKVAEGRNIGRDSILAIARGRVWTGSDALRLGLVDELGGFDAALRAARAAADSPEDSDVNLRVFPRERSILETILDPRESSSYPSAIASIISLSNALRVVTAELRRIGLFTGSGALTMPPVPISY